MYLKSTISKIFYRLSRCNWLTLYVLFHSELYVACDRKRDVLVLKIWGVCRGPEVMTETQMLRP